MPEKAMFGAAAYANMSGLLPNPFPRTMGPNAMKYLQEVVDAGLATDMVARFEAAFARSYGVKHAIATPGCTAALEILAAAWGFEPGDEVIVSSVTDYGTVAGIIHQQLIPVFADVQPGRINIDAAAVERCLTSRTRAILCVHMTGIVCEMDEINRLARKHGIPVYEDVCQAAFGRYGDRLAGTLSHAAAFSFDAEKTIGSDVGGALLTNDDALAERARFVGIARGGHMEPGFGRRHDCAGYAMRISAASAAITLAQLEIAPDNVRCRDRMARLLLTLLQEIPGIAPLQLPESTTLYSCWMLGFGIDPAQFRCDADEFARQLVAEGLTGAGTCRYYHLPEAVRCLARWAGEKSHQFAPQYTASVHRYGAGSCPEAHRLLDHFIRWATFCEKYREEDCRLAADLVRRVAARNRR